jgi:hypothetical protein
VVSGNAASGPQGSSAPAGGEQKTLADMLEERQKQLDDLDQLQGKPYFLFNVLLFRYLKLRDDKSIKRRQTKRGNGDRNTCQGACSVSSNLGYCEYKHKCIV